MAQARVPVRYTLTAPSRHRTKRSSTTGRQAASRSTSVQGFREDMRNH